MTADSNLPLSPVKRALLALEEMTAKVAALDRERREPIAVIGLGCRFPGAADIDAFWQLLQDGRDAVSEVPRARWDADQLYDPDPRAPGRVSTKWGGFLPAIDTFDPEFFGISPREAASMDPQQRLLLEVAWEALENAAQGPDRLAASRTGVFVGLTSDEYAHLFLKAGDTSKFDVYFASGIARSVAGGRISYVLGLQGPNLAIDTACSSSLVAVHTACLHLRGGECRMAIAGGANIVLSPDITMAFSKAGMMASDGRCKTFDARADGFVRGEGCGVVVLKRLSDAIADGDRVLALIRGSAVNQDGRSSGLTVPNGPAQEAVIRHALERGGVEGHDIDYVEAHGTGTSLGDPIEAHALRTVLGPGRTPATPLLLGSVKTNVGHLESAAGIAGLIKVVLSLQHDWIPAHLHYQTLNPHIDWQGVPVEIATGGRAWPRGTRRRLAGVSAFGFSGTNAHVIVEEPPVRPPSLPSEDDRPAGVLALSARTPEALRVLASRYATALQVEPRPSLADICYSANAGRVPQAERAAIVASSGAELVEKLQAFAAGSSSAGISSGRAGDRARVKVAFLFPGQGAQYAGMGRELYETEPVFRAALDECERLLAKDLDVRLPELLWGAHADLLDDTTYTQPALFAIEWALAALWRSWGVEPSVLLGHSVGEYVAACVAGVYSLADGLHLIAARGRLMGGLPRAVGTMAAVLAPVDDVQLALASHGGEVSIAAINGLENVVLAGNRPDVEAIASRFEGRGHRVERLRVSHAFHSSLMAPIESAFEEEVRRTALSPPGRALISSVTGAPMSAAEAIAPAYWRRQVRDTVRFHDALRSAAAHGATTWIEVGPGTTLVSFARQAAAGHHLLAPSLRKTRSETVQLLESAGAAWTRGVPIDWARFDQDRMRQRIALPTYPFERHRCWVEFSASTAAGPALEAGSHPLLGESLDLAGEPDATVWRNRLSDQTPPWMADHRVHDRVLAPMTAYLEMLTAAGASVLAAPGVVLSDVVMYQPLVLTAAGATEIQTRRQGATLKIHSRRDGSWVLHAEAQFGSAPAALNDVPLGALRERIATAVSVEQFYDDLAARGHRFGASFRGVTSLFTGDREALAQVELPAVAGRVDRYRIHPALLDACVQTLAAALPIEAGASYLPIAIAQFVSPGSFTGPVWVHASVPDDPAHDILRASITVVTEDGRPLAVLRDLELRRTLTASSRSHDDNLFQMAWRATNQGTLDLPAPEELAAAARLEAPGLSSRFELDQYDALRPALDALCLSAIADALIQLDVELAPGTVFNESAIVEASGVVPAQRRLFTRVLQIAAESGLLRRRGGDWECIAAAAHPDMTWTSLRNRFPAYDAELVLTERCTSRLADVLRGRADPLQLLFPAGSTETAERLYSASPSAQVFNGLIALAIAKGVSGSIQPIRLLEIGAGTGGTTTHVVPVLPADRVSYTYTDLSPFFVARARDRFAAYPFMRYRPLDIESDPQAQGLTGGGFDIVIAANVLHATADLDATMRHVRQLLAPNGLLVMLEVTSREAWIDLTFGMTEGWWRFTDTSVRPDYPLISADDWGHVLARTGFGPVARVEVGARSLNTILLTHAVPVRAPAGTAAPVLIVGGRGDAEARIVDAIGRDCPYSVIGPDEDVAAAAASHDWRAIVHAVAADIPDLSSVQPGAIEILERRICGSLVEVLRGAARRASATPPRLLTLTAGAVAARSGEPVHPLQALVWGLGRTIAYEHPELTSAVVDLDAANHANWADAIAHELAATDGESQVAWRGRERLAGRISPASLSEDAPPRIRLSVSRRGVLDSLELTPAARRAPKPGEVEIEVDLAGLSFRDVLNVLGMYPGDPGPLGGECAGRIAALGAGVTSFAIGDEVVAVAPGCHDGYVTADARMVARRPAALPAESALSLPISFITAAFTLEHLAGIRPGQRVLIHAGAGGVGLAAIQLARRAGAEVFATAGSDSKRDLLRSLGVAHVFNSRTTAFAGEILERTGGRGVDIVLNSLAGEFITASFAVIARGGTFLEIGKSGIWTTEQVAALGKDLSYFVVDWSTAVRDEPALIQSMLQKILDDAASGGLQPLPTVVFPFSEAVTAYRFMAQARHTGRILLRQRAAGTAVRSDATYLITGGTRGLGLAAAEWLVSAGARQLVLVGQREPGPESAAIVDGFRSRGVVTQVARADVADGSAMQRIFEALPGGLASLRGIVHSAGVLDDGVLLQQDWAQFRRVLAPKVDGAFHLHRLSAGAPLDFFVMFSSIASVLGGAGQGNHAAANAFEDALAHARTAAGLPATSINWGAWAGIGSAARPELQKRRRQLGLDDLTPAEGIARFADVLRAAPTQISVARMDWRQFASQWPAERCPRWLQEIYEPRPATGQGAAPAAAAPPVSLKETVTALPESNRRSAVEQYVHSLALRILGFEPNRRIDPRQPLNEIGLDSLMAVEFRNALAAGIGTSLPATLLFSYPAIDDVTGFVMTSVFGSAARTEAPDSGARPAAIDAIAELSDEEVDRLLAEKSGGRL